MRGHGRRRGTRRVLCTGVLGTAVLALSAPAAQATISINDVQVNETNSTVEATFTVARSASLFAGAVTVQYATVAESAKAPGDYADASGAISFPSALLGGNQSTQV